MNPAHYYYTDGPWRYPNSCIVPCLPVAIYIMSKDHEKIEILARRDHDVMFPYHPLLSGIEMRSSSKNGIFIEFYFLEYSEINRYDVLLLYEFEKPFENLDGYWEKQLRPLHFDFQDIPTESFF